jgi:ATP-dependent RNA circularization protein (DNA/RNA ligase family)
MIPHGFAKDNKEAALKAILTGSEKNRIIAVVMSYNSLTEKYSLTNDLLATMETKDLIKKIKDLKWQLDNNENEGVKNNDDNDNIE